MLIEFSHFKLQTFRQNIFKKNSDRKSRKSLFGKFTEI